MKIFLLVLSISTSPVLAKDNCILEDRNITDGKSEVHGSTIVETKRGFLSAWFSGGEGQAKATIQGSWWNGQKWSKPFLLADGIENGVDHPVWNPVLFINDDGDIELNYKVGPSPFSWWGRSKISKDIGSTWSADEALSTDPKVFGPIRAKPLKLHDGSWIAGSSSEVEIGNQEILRVHLENRSEGELGWSFDGSSFATDPGNFKIIQPVMIQYPSGEIQLLARSKRKTLIESWSKDGGQTWSALSATAVKNPGSAVDVIFHHYSKQAVLVYNDTDLGRGVLNAATSVDGKKWTNSCLLKQGMVWNEYSYPAVIEDSQGRIHVTFTVDRRNIKHIIFRLN